MNEWLKVYDDFAATHPDAVSKSGYIIDGKPCPAEIFTNWVDYVNGQVNIKASDCVYDAGCGSGLFLKEFSRYSDNLFGCDGSIEQVSFASSALPDARLVVGDIRESHFPEKSFDFIFCNSVFLLLDGFEQATEALDVFRKLSRPRGQIWIGDIPDVTPGLDDRYRRVGQSLKLPLQHFPVSFFIDYCNRYGLHGNQLQQLYKPAEMQNNRYDFHFILP